MNSANISKGTLKITLSNVSQYVIAALFYITVTKTNALTEADLGTLSFLGFLSSTFSLLTMIALPTALTKFISEKLGKNQKQEAAATQKTVTKTILTLSVVGLIITILISQLISQQILNNPEYLILIIINFIYAVLVNIRNLCDSILRALYLFGKMATITIAFIVSSRIIAIILAILKMGAQGVIIGYIIGSIIAIIIALNSLRGKFLKTKKTQPLKPLLSYSLPLFLTSIANLVVNWADIVIITFLIGEIATGIYSIVINSIGTLSMLYLPITITIFPAISIHHGLKKLENISNILRISSRYILFILIPTCIGLAIVAPAALTLLYGPNYAKGATALAILSITTIIIALLRLYTTTFSAIAKTVQTLKINIIAAIITLLTLIPLVPPLEITGAAISRLITNAIALILTIYLLKREIKIHMDKEALWKSTVSTAAFIPVLLIIETTLSTQLNIIQTLAIEIVTAAAIYTLFLYLFKALKTEDFQLLKQAFPKALTKYISIIERIFVR